ncbi:MAG: OadG family protein [Fretibacterium sp.]|nr:OadG family protein [Fretibacterium sp.]
MHFEGISGAISVSIVAFSIVFGVLLLLTATIYAMKLFSGSGSDKPTNGETAGKASAKAAAPAPARAQAVSQSKIVAAITAAIMAATGGRGRILSIKPAVAVSGAPFTLMGTGSTWRASGIVALVNNRLNRTWKQ